MVKDRDRCLLKLPQGRLSYRDEGEGPALVFAHGLLVGSDIWDEVVARLVGQGLRCIRPELPLGSHRIPLDPDADNSPPGAADLLGDFLEALSLERVILVGNDSGGALCQILAATRPGRVAGVVLTNCDIGHAFPPFPYSLLPRLARLPGGVRGLAASLQTRPGRRLAYGPTMLEPIADSRLREWTRPVAADAGVRRDVSKLLLGVDKSQTLEAAERLRGFDRPVLFAWGVEDGIFKRSHAQWLAERLPDATIAPVEAAKTFAMLDNPSRVAELIAGHAERLNS